MMHRARHICVIAAPAERAAIAAETANKPSIVTVRVLFTSC